jgi:hypothetical protein
LWHHGPIRARHEKTGRSGIGRRAGEDFKTQVRYDIGISRTGDLLGAEGFRVLNPDGSTGSYRGQKAFFPLDPSRVGYLGSYYNDSGVNLQYDVFQEKPQPETKAWMSYYRQMRPDAVVNFHCDAGSIMGYPDHYLPVGFQHLFSRIAGQVMARLVGEKLPVRRLSWAEMPGLGKPFLDQNTAIYHASGALPLMVELPGGGGTESPWTLDTLLDCGLLTLEEIFSAAHMDGLRPYMTRAKKSP